MEDNEMIKARQENRERLESDINQARQKRKYYDELKKYAVISGVVISLLMYLFYHLWSNKVFIGIGVFYMIVTLITLVVDFGKQIDFEIEGLQNDIDLITSDNSREQRAERLFKSHEIALKRYYQQALKQSSIIFIAGIVCILIGFFFMGISFYAVIEDQITDKSWVVISGAISGLLTDFIAVIYLRIYSETTKSFTVFHNKLVFTNHLHFVNFLISKIENEDIRNEALKQISNVICLQKERES